MTNHVEVPKFIKNISGGDLFHSEAGLFLPDADYAEVTGNKIQRLNDAQLWTWWDAGNLLFATSDDGLNDIVNKYEGWHRLFDYCFGIPFLSPTNSDRANGFVSIDAQHAIEESRQISIGNDLDTLQFGRQGNVSNNTYLLTLNNIASVDSPDTLKYNITFLGFSLSNSNAPTIFTLELYKTDIDHLNNALIYSETFEYGVHPNFSKHAGYTAVDVSVDVDKGWGLYMKVVGVGNPKPADLSVILWYRQR